MNIKKVFASLTGVLMLATTVTPLVTGAASYGAELEGAYAYAYSKGITTMPSIDSANMYGEVTRGQLAKMISNWAEAELGKTADVTRVCSFTDEGKAAGDLAMYLKKACQMGLMGQGIAKFRPNDKVTRGEFGTTLSRALWGGMYEGGNPYYANHLMALRDAGIMTRIETPSQLEIRGYVMLMLQRAVTSKKDTTSCTDPMIILACSVGGENCPAACKKEEEKKEDKNSWNGEKSGDLSVALTTHNGMISIPKAGVIKVAELKFDSSKDVTIHSLDVTRLGLSNNVGLRAWIEKDGKRISSTSTFFGDSKSTLVFNGGYVVKRGETLDLIISLSEADAEKNIGSEFSFKVSDIASTAKNTTVSPDTTGVFRTANYSATSLSFTNVVSTKREYNLVSDSVFTFGEFRLQNNSKSNLEKNILLRSLLFRVSGNDLANLKDFKLLRNGKELKTSYSVSGRDLTLVVNDQIDSGKSASYKLVATPTNIESDKGDTYTFAIRRAEDVIAEEIGQNSVGYRVSVLENNAKFDGITFGEVTVKGGNIVLSRDQKFPSVVNADWGYSDVTIAKGTIKVNQSVKFEKGLALEVEKVNGVAADEMTKVQNIFRRVAFSIDGRQYQASTIAGTGVIFDSEIYLDKGTHNVELIASIENEKKDAIKTVELKNITKESLLGGRYLNLDENEFNASSTVGSLRVAKINIQADKIGFKKTGPTEDVRLAKGNTDERVVFKGELRNTTDRVLEVSQYHLKAVNLSQQVVSNKKLADVYVVVNGQDTTNNLEIYNNESGVSLDATSTTLEPGKTLTFEVRLINDADLPVDSSYRFEVDARGTIEGNEVKSVALKSAYVRVNEGATTNLVASNNARNTIVIPGVAKEIATFNYNVRNDSVDVQKVEFAIAGFDTTDIDDVTIHFDNITPATATIIAGDNNEKMIVSFANVVTLPAKNYKVRVEANFSESSLTTASKGMKKKLTGVTINGKSASLDFNHWVAKAYPRLTVKEKIISNANPRLDLSVSKNSDDQKVVLKKITGKQGEDSTTDIEFTRTEGNDRTFPGTNGLELSTVAEVLRNTEHKSYVTSVDFSVTDENGDTVDYIEVTATEIADFASLAL